MTMLPNSTEAGEIRCPPLLPPRRTSTRMRIASQYIPSSTRAVDMNNAAVMLMRQGRHGEAMQLLDWGFLGLSMRLPPEVEGGRSGGGNFASMDYEYIHADRLHNPPCQVPTGSVPSTTATTTPVIDQPTTLHPVLALPLRREDMIIHSVSGDDFAPSACVSMADESDLKTSPSNFFAMYNRAFMFNEDALDLDLRAWLNCVPHIPSVILFNAGLSFHRLAIQHGKTSLFDKALELYRLSKALLEENARCGIYMTELDILLLALSNNMGCIHSHFSRIDDARCCLDCMLAVFCLSTCKILLTKEEYVFFYINLLLSINRRPIFAAAA